MSSFDPSCVNLSESGNGRTSQCGCILHIESQSPILVTDAPSETPLTGASAILDTWSRLRKQGECLHHTSVRSAMSQSGDQKSATSSTSKRSAVHLASARRRRVLSRSDSVVHKCWQDNKLEGSIREEVASNGAPKSQSQPRAAGDRLGPQRRARVRSRSRRLERSIVTFARTTIESVGQIATDLSSKDQPCSPIQLESVSFVRGVSKGRTNKGREQDDQPHGSPQASKSGTKRADKSELDRLVSEANVIPISLHVTSEDTSFNYWKQNLLLGTTRPLGILNFDGGPTGICESNNVERKSTRRQLQTIRGSKAKRRLIQDHSQAGRLLDNLFEGAQSNCNSMAPNRSGIKLTLGEHVIACATAAATTISLSRWSVEPLEDQEKTPGTAMTLVSADKDESKRSDGEHLIFDYSLSALERSEPEAGCALSSACLNGQNANATGPQTSLDGGHEHSRHLPSSLHHSLDNLRSIVEKNLVATSIGLYILISLTLIFLLSLTFLPVIQRPVGVEGGTQARETELTIKRITQSQEYKLVERQTPPEIAARASDDLDNTTTSIDHLGDKITPAPISMQAAVASSAQATTSEELDKTTDKPANQNTRPSSRSFSRLWDVVLEQPCQALKVPFCTKSLDSMLSSGGLTTGSSQIQMSHLDASVAPYSTTILPNQFTHARQPQIERSLQRYEPIVDIRCYALMPLFLCSIFAPKCVPVVGNFSSSSGDGELYSKMSTSSSGSELFDIDSRLASGSSRLSKVVPPDAATTDKPNGNSSHGLSRSRLVPPCRSLCKGKQEHERKTG